MDIHTENRAVFVPRNVIQFMNDSQLLGLVLMQRIWDEAR